MRKCLGPIESWEDIDKLIWVEEERTGTPQRASKKGVRGEAAAGKEGGGVELARVQILQDDFVLSFRPIYGSLRPTYPNW